MSLRGLVTSLGLAALLAPASLGAQVALDTAGLEPVLVELALGRYGSRTVPAYRSSGDALLPVLQLAEMAELRARPLTAGAVELTLEPGRQVVTLDPARAEIRKPGGTIALLPADRVLGADDQYLSTRVLGELLRVGFAVNWSELSVTLLDADSLPLGRRIARERAHAMAHEAAAFLADLPARGNALLVELAHAHRGLAERGAVRGGHLGDARVPLVAVHLEPPRGEMAPGTGYVEIEQRRPDRTRHIHLPLTEVLEVRADRVVAEVDPDFVAAHDKQWIRVEPPK